MFEKQTGAAPIRASNGRPKSDEKFDLKEFAKLVMELNVNEWFVIPKRHVIMVRRNISVGMAFMPGKLFSVRAATTSDDFVVIRLR